MAVIKAAGESLGVSLLAPLGGVVFIILYLAGAIIHPICAPRHHPCYLRAPVEPRPLALPTLTETPVAKAPPPQQPEKSLKSAPDAPLVEPSLSVKGAPLDVVKKLFNPDKDCQLCPKFNSASGFISKLL